MLQPSGVAGLVSLLALLLALLLVALLLVALHSALLLPPSCCSQGRVCVASPTGVQKLDVGDGLAVKSLAVVANEPTRLPEVTCLLPQHPHGRR